jgi:pyruvate formate lyase activating enzyme
VTIADLWHLLYPQLELLRNIGGITVSGGEPLLQSRALQQLLRLCREAGIHTVVETSGALPTQHLADVVGLVDCWLFGLRPTPAYTPPRAGLIVDNIGFLAGAERRVIVRTPVVAGITDLLQSLDRVASTMRAHRLTEIELLPFHAGTPHYYHALGISCPLGSEAIPSAERLRAVREYFEQRGFTATVRR